MNTVFSDIEQIDEFDNHKQVLFLYDKPSGLRAFVAIYNDTLGPAVGATRMWQYKSEMDAVRDALKLSRTMAYKCALAGVKYGGGKGVIIGDSKKIKTKSLLEEYARRIDGMGGRFVTGTDVGLEDEDIKVMRKITPYMIGYLNHGRKSPSQMAGLGVFYGIKGCFEEVLMNGEVSGKRFAIKGLGKTGIELAMFLHNQGAEIIGADVDAARIAFAKKKLPKLKIISPDVIHKQRVNVFCPCALGGDLNKKTINELRCDFVIGTENNQLESPEVGDLLYRLGIVYAPDYVVNAGGLISVLDELSPKGYNHERVLERVGQIKRTARTILARSQKEKKPTHRIADKMAEEILMHNG